MNNNFQIDLDNLQVCEVDSNEASIMTPTISAEEILKEAQSDERSEGWLSRMENKQRLLEKYGRVDIVAKFDDLDIEEIRKNFGKNLIKLREQLGFTASDMAEIFNCSKMNYGNWEHRGNLPKYDGLIKILKFYKLTPEELLLTDVDAVEIQKRLIGVNTQ